MKDRLLPGPAHDKQGGPKIGTLFTEPIPLRNLGSRDDVLATLSHHSGIGVTDRTLSANGYGITTLEVDSGGRVLVATRVQEGDRKTVVASTYLEAPLVHEGKPHEIRVFERVRYRKISTGEDGRTQVTPVGEMIHMVQLSGKEIAIFDIDAAHPPENVKATVQYAKKQPARDVTVVEGINPMIPDPHRGIYQFTGTL